MKGKPRYRKMKPQSQACCLVALAVWYVGSKKRPLSFSGRSHSAVDYARLQDVLESDTRGRQMSVRTRSEGHSYCPVRPITK